MRLPWMDLWDELGINTLFWRPFNVMATAFLLALMASSGFLMVTGIKTYSLYVAGGNVALFLILAGFSVAGYGWALLAQSDSETQWDLDVEHWLGFMAEGAQLVLFYGLSAVFFASAIWLTYPYGLLLIGLGLLLHPVIAFPLVASRHNRNFLGLVDTVLSLPHFLQGELWQHWGSTFYYAVLVFGVILPLACVALAITGIGILTLPGLFMSAVLGFCWILKPEPIIQADYKEEVPQKRPSPIHLSVNTTKNPFSTEFHHPRRGWKSFQDQ